MLAAEGGRLSEVPPLIGSTGRASLPKLCVLTRLHSHQASVAVMEEEEDEDIYAPTDITNGSNTRAGEVDTSVNLHTTGGDLEEGEEGEEVEEDDSDSVLFCKTTLQTFHKC